MQKFKDILETLDDASHVKKIQLFDKEKNLKIIAQNNQSEFIIVILPYEYQTRSCTSDILIPQKKIRNISSQN